MVRLALVALACCSGAKPRPVVDDARHVTPPRDAATSDAAAGKGDVQVRVEWHDVPVVARASPGRTSCGTPVTPAVSPTTTWGLPDAVVTIDRDLGKLPDPGARVVLHRCALVPRVIVAGAAVAIASDEEAPARLVLASSGANAGRRPIELPIAGHEVQVSLVPGVTYTLATDEHEPQAVAWIVAANRPTLVTDATGQATFRELPAGTYPVTAWLPARDRTGHGQVTVVAGALAEVTLDLTAP